MKECDKMLEQALRLTDLMVETADLGDSAREDVGCGVLYGLLRDSAFKIRKVAEEEVEAHRRKADASLKKGGKKGITGNRFPHRQSANQEIKK